MPALKWLVFKHYLGYVCVNLVGGKNRFEAYPPFLSLIAATGQNIPSV